VFIQDGVAAVLPPLILCAFRGLRLILEVAVSIPVASFPRPVQNAPYGVPLSFKECSVTAPREVMRQRDHVCQWTHEVAIIAPERKTFQARQWAAPHLLHDAAGFLIPLRVIASALQATKTSERRLKELAAIEHDSLPADCDAVATEQRGIERN